MSEFISIARVLIGVVILAGAAASDVRTRRVSDKFWIVMGSVGLGILGFEMLYTGQLDFMAGAPYEFGHFLILPAIAIMFFDVFWKRGSIFEGGNKALVASIYTVALICILGMLWLEGFGLDTLGLVMIPVMILVAHIFYQLNVLAGGADAKAMMAVAILLPFYPIVESLPLISYAGLDVQAYSIGFPFVFLVLMNAAIINVIFAPLVNPFRNLKNRDFGGLMFLGYRLDLDDVPNRQVWPMEVVRDGEIVVVLFPRKSGIKNVDDIGKEIAALRAAGVNRIWVQPKYPFILAMFFGLLFSFVVGNPMMLLF